MLHFYTFWKRQKTFAFFRGYRNWIFSGGIEIEFWANVGWLQGSISLKFCVAMTK